MKRLLQFIPSLPGDVISESEKGGERMRRRRRRSGNNKRSQGLDEENMRQTGCCRKAGGFKCILTDAS